MPIDRRTVLAAMLSSVAGPARAQLNRRRGTGSRWWSRSLPVAESMPSARSWSLSGSPTSLKQPVVVENRTGAGGMVGADSVAKATPDGHTILLMESSAVLHKWLHKNVPFDVITDFAPIAQVATSPLFLIAHPSLPANNVRELIDLARKSPGKLSVGTPGVGTPHHLAMLMMNVGAKIDIVHVPYRGTGPSLNDVLGGQIPLIWASPIAVMPHVATGKLKLLGTASAKREPAIPDLPTVAESGVPDFAIEIRYGIAAPAKTPPAVVAQFENEFRGDRRRAGYAGADAQGRLRPRLSSAAKCLSSTFSPRRLRPLGRGDPGRRHRPGVKANQSPA